MLPADLFISKPLNILTVALVFLTAYLALRLKPLGIVCRPLPLLIASAAWGTYAGWERWVQAMTPEANIRVDLLVIWPILAIVSAWAVFRIGFGLARRRP